jgi:hypothetical protein
VHHAQGLGIRGARVQLDELVVVDFQEVHGGRAGILETERLLEAQTLVEGCRRMQVGDPKCYMRDAAERQRLRRGNRRAQQAERDLPDLEAQRISILSADLSAEQSVSWR